MLRELFLQHADARRTADHLESGESVPAGMAREADEELDITIREEDLDRVHTLHHFDTADGAGHLQLFFAYTGEIASREPDKCAALRFWSLDGLPEPIVGDTADALAQITAGRPLSVVGWPA